MNARNFALFAMVAVAALAIAEDKECCTKAMAGNGWCDGCKHGYVNGVEMKSKKLHDAMCGAEVKEAPKCETCKSAMDKGGWCDKCNAGIASKKVYKTKFGWVLAMGKHVDAKDVKCEACKKNLGKSGWCEACKAGVVGCDVYADKATYEQAVKAHAVVADAAKSKCETCAVAMVSNGTCDACKATYKDGKKVEAEKKP